MNWFSRPPLAPAAQAYVAATPRRWPRATPLAKLRCVVIDAETSGFQVGTDRLLSLAITEINHGRIEVARTQAWFVYQPNATVNAATAVHGILPAETAAGMPEARVLDELLPRLAGAVLVGHHLAFDAAMLDAALRRHFRTGLRNPLLDTAVLAMDTIDAFQRTGYANQRPPTLDELCTHCGLQPIARHTAEGDAFTTAELFLLLTARLRQRLGRELRAGDLRLRSL